MSNTVFIRNFLGSDFRLADTARLERADKRPHKFEEFLIYLKSFKPAGRLTYRDAHQLDSLVKQQHRTLVDAEDAEIRQAFTASLEAFCQPATDRPKLLAMILACVGEASQRTLGMWPHPVQFLGAKLLFSGAIAEMHTGEGKTLVAALAATVMAGSGVAVHILSTNDYLAQRDCEEMQPLFDFFELSHGFVIGGMETPERQQAYQKHICYVSGKEIVFDYLKDQIQGHGKTPIKIDYLHQLAGYKQQAAAPLVPALTFCIVDEADSILIDEARTPMILSREAPSVIEPDILTWAIEQAQTLIANKDFKIDYAQRDIELILPLTTSIAAVPQQVRPVWHTQEWQYLLIKQALQALYLYEKEKHYLLIEGKVQIVDESTGRIMADRSWQQGLHQLIETKEGVELTAGRDTLARLTFQRFFRKYFLLSGLTGTGLEVHRELVRVYNLHVYAIPPNRPKQRQHLPAWCLPTLQDKYHAIATDAIRAAREGRPVLVGTKSVDASEAVSEALHSQDATHTVLNARQDAEEAEIIARAGMPGQITVATNMAGRGTDIKLSAAAREAGGLHVILCEYHDSARVDRQLFGRSGRQGDPGSCRAIVSAQDKIFTDNSEIFTALLCHFRGRWLIMGLLMLSVWYVQYLTQQRSYRTRMNTLKQDQKLSHQIGFAGKTL